MKTPPMTLQAGQEIHGFRVEAVTAADEIRAIAYRITHPGSGARLLHLHAEDTENLFSISFATPPPDKTGLPHILEHAVLAGSRKFPVREPFFEMVKMSMATFINAMTGADCTYYPVASNVRADLFNLADVYFDAVFHPLLTPETFQREGHHLAPADKGRPDDALTVNGIVYNEMKGAYSDPEGRLYRHLTQSLLPDTVYAMESGGDPTHIPELTYEDLKRFHEAYYHPANAYFYFYGDIPTEAYLRFLSDRLAPFSRKDYRPSLTRQPRWTAPRAAQDDYPVAADEPLTERTYLTLHWLVGDATDPDEAALWAILDLILLGNEGAPLRKMLIDSKLGQDLFASGSSSVGWESTFSVGIKGSEPDRVEPFSKRVLEALADIAEKRITDDRVEAAFQQAAYHYLEIVPMFPLHTMQHVLGAWTYGRDPLLFLRMSRHLDACRRRYAEDPSLFSRLIRERLLGNPHRLTSILRPDRAWQSRTDAAFAERMTQIRSKLSAGAVRALAATAAGLETLSGTPNSPEALATLPQLKVSELPRRPRHIPTAAQALPNGAELLVNGVFANGVNYLHLDIDLAGLPDESWPYLPRYVDAISKLGAAGMNYEQVAARVARCTGGIGCAPVLNTHVAAEARPVWSLRFSLKTLDRQLEPALALLHDLLFAVDPRDLDRWRQVLEQTRAHYRTSLVYDGSRTAALHASRHLTAEGALAETLYGIPQLRMSETLTSGFDGLADDLMARIEAIRRFLLAGPRFAASFTGSDHAADRVRQTLGGWLRDMRDERPTRRPSVFVAPAAPAPEGLAGPVQVAHCVQVIPAPHASHPDEPLITVGTRMVSLDYMLSEIRLKGNAYGAWAQYGSLGQTLQFGSYNDPHVSRTLETFSRVRDYVSHAEWTQTDVDRAIIGTAKQDEQPIRPGSATSIALHRHRTGQTNAWREQRYAAILAATPASVRRAMLAVLDAGMGRGAICVMSSRENLEKANRERPEAPLVIEDILRD